MTILTERMALIIDGNTAGAVTAVERLSAAEKAAADRAEMLQARMADLNTRIAKSTTGGTNAQKLQLSKMEQEYRGLTSTLAKVPPIASKAEQALAKIGVTAPAGLVSAATRAAPGLVSAAAVFGGFEFLKSGVAGFENLATQIRQVAQASGASVPDASRLVAITTTLGLSSDSVAQSMFRLGRQVETQPQKLAAYGIAVARTKAGNVDLYKTLENVTTAYQNTTDPARRAQLVFTAFGRAGATMLPILNANKNTLKEIAAEAAKQGLIFNASDLTNARQLAIASQEMKDAFHGMAISASKTLVPALTEAARLTTSIVDFMNKPVIYDGSKQGKSLNDLGNASSLPGIINQFEKFFGGGKKKGPSAAEVARQTLLNTQQQAAQQTLVNAAGGTLDESTIQASGIVAVASAKQSLAATKTALATARDEQVKARRALDDLRQKNSGSHASADAIGAAEARVTAAEAKLRAAEYKGGDARIAGAQASVLSAQDRLNKLRASGTSETNRLANAEDRLRVANGKVAAAQAKVVAAHKAVAAAGGNSATSALAGLDKQITDKTSLANAQAKLASEGASTATLAYLDKLNQSAPGTLVKVAHTATAALVGSLNTKLDSLHNAEDLYSQIAGDPASWAKAGAERGTAFANSFFNAFGAPKPGVHDFGPAPSSRSPKSGVRDFGSLSTVVNIHAMHVTTDDPAKVAKGLADRARFKALSAGSAN